MRLAFRLSSALCRAILWIYPAEFRHAVAAQLMVDFDDGWRAAHRRGRAPEALRFAGRQILDLARSAAPEWRSPSGGPSRARKPSVRTRLESWLQDGAFALRSLRRDPLFAVTVTVVTSLGLACAVVVWSLVESIVLEPLPYPEAGRLVSLSESYRESQSKSVAYPNYLDWRERNTTLEDLAARASTRMNVSGDGTADALRGAAVSANFFALFGVEPLRGRLFSEREAADREPVVLLSEGLWRSRFAADEAVVGREMRLDGRGFTVVGVVAEAHEFPLAGSQLWVPLQTDLSDNNLVDRTNHPGIEAFGRLRPGVAWPEAAEDLDRVASELALAYPDSNAEAGVRLRPLHERLVGGSAATLWLLLGAVGLALASLCANIASLALARAARRRGEVAVRAAIGASRGRLARLLIAEGMILGTAAGGIGLALSAILIDLVRGATDLGLPRAATIELDASVVLFAMGCALVCGLAFSLAPASRLDASLATHSLRGDGGADSARPRRGRSTLVAAQVALAVVLLAAAALMIQTTVNLTRADDGLEPHGLLTAYLGPPPSQYPENQDRVELYRSLLARVRGLPGVVRAAGGDPLPMSGRNNQSTLSNDGFPQVDEGGLRVDVARVTPGYLEAMGIPLRSGRDFREDDSTADPVVIVDETLAAFLWPGVDPIGQRVRFRGPVADRPWHRVVGVAAHVKNYGVRRESRFELYMPYTLSAWGMSLIVEAESEPLLLTAAIRSSLAELDPLLPLTSVATMSSYVDATLTRERLVARVLAGFAIAALVVALLGLYGVVAYGVTMRTREFGIRMALGAGRWQVLGGVVGGGLALALVGATLGIVGALLLGRLMSNLLFGVGAADPATLGGVAVALVAVATVATLVPARRALRVDPAIALRGDTS